MSSFCGLLVSFLAHHMNCRLLAGMCLAFLGGPPKLNLLSHYGPIFALDSNGKAMQAAQEEGDQVEAGQKLLSVKLVL